MSTLKRLILAIVLICLATSYEKINDHNKLMRYYEEHSYYPIVHTYYNHHFSKSKQFQDFLDVLEETEYRNKDYAKFVITDCEQFNDGQTYICDELNKRKDNRAVFGYFPSSKFINFAGKKMQNPPMNRKMEHYSDVYTADQFERFFKPMIPNFYQEINSLQENEAFLLPRYVPKIIFFSRQDTVPSVMNQIGVYFFLKFDFGFVSDLTESVVNKANITKFPSLVVLQYNYETSVYELNLYSDSDFSEQKYEQIKKFLQDFALKEQRNDILFHKIKMPENDDIIKTDNKVQLKRYIDMANTWAIIAEFNGNPARLQALKNKYGRFFEYIHSLQGTSDEEKLLLFDPKEKSSYELVQNDIHFKTLAQEEFLTNVTAWLNKNFVVFGVRQQYGHICSLAQSAFFRELTYCFIAREDDYEKISKRLGMQFQFGFACYEHLDNGTRRVKGRAFRSNKYEDIYLDAQYQTKLKAKDIIDNFVQQPIKQIEGDQIFSNLCAFPTKKCLILFTHQSKKDRTAYDYLADVSINYINDYQFYEIDLSCNPEFIDEIPALEKNLGGLVVYNQRTASYVVLKAKISKTTIQKFLKINLTDNKKIPFTKFQNPGITVHSCLTQQQQPKSEETININQDL